MRHFFLLLTLLFISTFSKAQSTIHLLIKDPSGEVLPFVHVTITKTDSTQVISQGLSSMDGSIDFSIKELPINVIIHHLGYERTVRKIEKVGEAPVSIILEQKINSLQEIVVTGVGRPTKLDEAISIYKIVSKKDIQGQGAVTLQDALNNQLGISIGQDAMTGGKIKMQGMSGDNVKILIDGLPVNGREGQNIDLSTINLSNIEKIEMVQGPMSVMYGSDALAGVINLITHNPDKSKRVGIQSFYESTGKYNFDAILVYKLNKHSITVGGGRNLFQGWDPENSNKRNPLWRPKVQHFGNLKYTYSISPSASITYSTDYMNDLLIVKGDPSTFSYYNRHVRDDEFRTKRWMNRLQAKWKTGENGYWESNNAFSLYQRNRSSYFTDLSTLKRNLSTFEGDQSQSAFNDFTFRATYNNKAGILSYTFGYDVNLEVGNSSEKISGGQKFIGDYALLLITDLSFSSKIKIQPALRTSYNTQYSSPLSPSFSFLYRPSSSFHLRASYAKGFRTPTLKEMYLDFKDSNHDIFGNSSLSPEKGHHAQLAMGYTIFQQGNNYNNISLTSFYNDVNNQITLAQSGNTIPGTPTPYTYMNRGRFRNLQLQLISQNQYQEFYISFGALFNQSIQTNSSPAYHYWEANANFKYSIPKTNSNLSVFYKFTGPAPIVIADVTQGLFTDHNVYSNAYHNLDASIETSFWKNKINGVLGVKNIFNNTIIGSTGTSQNPLAVSPHGSNDGSVNLSTGRSYFLSLRFNINH